MVDVISKTCLHPGCKTRPTFGYEGEKIQFCKAHKLEGMVNVKSKRCLHTDCKTIPVFGYEGGNAQFCSAHKLDGMVDVKNKKCSHPGCITQPTFGYEGGNAQYCNAHKLEGMVDVISKRCSHTDCKTIPVFGHEGGDAQYCSVHKLEGMVNVKDKSCSHPGCKTIPTFGYEGGDAQFCKDHKLEGMVDVKHKRCLHPNCKTRSTFGYEGGDAQFCNAHKLDEMVDVKNKRCEHENCDIQPSYGNLYTKARTHCREHCTLNEYAFYKSNPICKYNDCDEKAYFYDQNDPNIYPSRCSGHKFSTDIELVYKLCNNCGEELYFPDNQKFCMNCGRYREKTLYHFKELEIKYLLQSNKIEFTHDRRVSKNGSNKRPDFLIVCDFGYIIVEVDEHQHRDYPMDKERERMKRIYQDIQLIKPKAGVMFIRYNPDEYEGLKLPDKKVKHKYLCEIITSFKTYPRIDTALCQMKLFYDGFDGNPKIECF